MAEELLTNQWYHPAPAHDKWAFGLLLLFLLFGQQPLDHQVAVDRASMEEGSQATLEYARSLCHLPDDVAYNKQVCAGANVAGCLCGCWYISSK